MKVVNKLSSTFSHTFSGSTRENWAQIIDFLEAGVFEKEEFYPKQCYFAFKTIMTGDTKLRFEQIEDGVEKQNWKKCIPSWYRPNAQDWEAIACDHPFSSFSYGLKCAIIVVYFHQNFQKGTAKDAWRNLVDAAQLPSESLERWAKRLQQLKADIIRIGRGGWGS